MGYPRDSFDFYSDFLRDCFERQRIERILIVECLLIQNYEMKWYFYRNFILSQSEINY